MKYMSKKRKGSRKKRKFVKGRWTQEENQKYIQFLLQNRNTFEIPEKRKELQIFLKMSVFLGNRSPNQCRSHHQKVQKCSSNKDIESICEFMLRQKLKKPTTKSQMVKRKYHKLKITGEGEGQPEDVQFAVENKNNLIKIVLILDQVQSW